MLQIMRFSLKVKDCLSIVRSLSTFFDRELIKSLAKETEFVRRKRQMTRFGFLHLCIFSVYQRGLTMSLGQLCSHLLQQGITMTTESLNERFNDRSVRFMKMAFDSAMQLLVLKNVTLDFLRMFRGIYLQDSTFIELPNVCKNKYPGFGGVASPAALKIDLTTNFQDGNSKLILKSVRQNDTCQTISNIQKRSLWLRDLGYYKLESLDQIDEADAFYISRQRGNLAIYEGKEKDSNRIEVVDLQKDLQPNQIRELQVHIGTKKRLPTRLIVQKLPKDIIAQKRHKLKYHSKRKCRSYSKKRLALCSVNMFITNIPAHTMPAKIIMQLYRIRWQIELVFKIWKSHYQINRVKKMKSERLECQMYGRLILILINSMIVNSFKIQLWNQYGIIISEYIAHKYLKPINQGKWVTNLCNRTSGLKKMLNLSMNIFAKYAVKSERKSVNPPLKFTLT